MGKRKPSNVTIGFGVGLEFKSQANDVIAVGNSLHAERIPSNVKWDC